MALTLTSLRLLSRANNRKPFTGPILTLGRQGIYASLDQCRAAIASQAGKVHPLPAGMDTKATLPAFRHPPYDRFTNDACAFWMMCGQEVEALDVSDHENADYIHDLNLPVPDHLRGRFGTIIDGGTLEHVFDIAQALRNIKAMLAPGGRVFHINPVGNWGEHGYYQFSPSLYHDYYDCNGFAMRECLLTAVSASDVDRLYSRRSPVWEWTPTRPSAPIVSGQLLSLHFEAAKEFEAGDRAPQQGGTNGEARNSRTGGTSPPEGQLQRMRARLQTISPSFGALAIPARRLIGRDLTRSPWGLRYLGKY